MKELPLNAVYVITLYIHVFLFKCMFVTSTKYFRDMLVRGFFLFLQLQEKFDQLLRSFQYHFTEKYLQEAWPVVKGALKEYGVACELNLVSSRAKYFFIKLLRLSG